MTMCKLVNQKSKTQNITQKKTLLQWRVLAYELNENFGAIHLQASYILDLGSMFI